MPPFLEALKVRLDGGCEQPGLEGGVPAIAGGWNYMILKVPSNPNHSMLLQKDFSDGRATLYPGLLRGILYFWMALFVCLMFVSHHWTPAAELT